MVNAIITENETVALRIIEMQDVAVEQPSHAEPMAPYNVANKTL